MTFGSLLPDLLLRAPAALSILFFRSIPFFLYACVARTLPWSRRLVVVAGSLVTGVVIFRADRDAAVIMVEWAPVLAAYFVLGAVLIHRLAMWLPLGLTKLGGVLALSAVLFMVLPAALLHRPVVAAYLILLGWEVMLKAHSYCVDVSSSGESPRFGECQSSPRLVPLRSRRYGDRADDAS